METVKEIKKVQVDGKQYFMPVEDIDIEKLVKKGSRLKAKMDATKKELIAVQDRLIEIAKARREGSTTVTLPGVSGKAVVTFRESFVLGDNIEELSLTLGPLFPRFFKKKSSFNSTAEFKKFMESGHALGIENAKEVKEAISEHVTIKETRPNVKMEITDS